MKRRIIPLLLALCLTAAILPDTALAASLEPAATTNNGYNDYYHNWDSPVCSYLFENTMGGLTRVEFDSEISYWQSIDGGEWHYVLDKEANLIVEEYDSHFQLQRKVDIPIELGIWGGFFAGEDYNFFVFGDENPDELDSREVMRVVKYSKDWKRLDAHSFYGLNTTVPFAAGSLDCAEYGGMLYIRTCHRMYKDMLDGVNHQANMMFAIRESDMKCTNSYYTTGISNSGYVSHSFNQFIMVDSEQRLVALDHGDSYPRSVVLTRYFAPAGSEQFLQNQGILSNSGYATMTTVQKIAGRTGDNETGVMVDGLAETKSGYVTAYSNNGRDNSVNPTYLAYVDKNTLQVTVRPISSAFCSTPVLASAGLDGGYVLWRNWDTDKVEYASYDQYGNIGEIHSTDARLSDCRPVLYNGELVWYVTDHSGPTFYFLGENGLRTLFNDVAGNVWYYEPVNWAAKNGITSGTSFTEFTPTNPCTRAQIVTFLWRAAGEPKPASTRNPFTDVKSGAYYYNAVLWAVEKGITAGSSDTTFSPDAICTRAETLSFLWRADGRPAATAVKSYNDVVSSDYYSDAINWAVTNGIAAGTSVNQFSPNAVCTRLQFVSFLWRDATGIKPSENAAPHDHNWVTQTMHYDAAGYSVDHVVGTEQIKVGREQLTFFYHCLVDGEYFKSGDEGWYEHANDRTHNPEIIGWEGGQDIYETRNIIETEWVEYFPAWNETITTCSICGAHK